MYGAFLPCYNAMELSVGGLLSALKHSASKLSLLHIEKEHVVEPEKSEMLSQ